MKHSEGSTCRLVPLCDHTLSTHIRREHLWWNAPVWSPQQKKGAWRGQQAAWLSTLRISSLRLRYSASDQLQQPRPPLPFQFWEFTFRPLLWPQSLPSITFPHTYMSPGCSRCLSFWLCIVQTSWSHSLVHVLSNRPRCKALQRWSHFKEQILP